MLSKMVHRLVALQVRAKALLVSRALVRLGSPVLPRPLGMIAAFLLLIFAAPERERHA